MELAECLGLTGRPAAMAAPGSSMQ
jgi:hypothetical protein